MPTINVAKPFNLLLTGSTDRLKFKPGVQEVSAEVAEHWYTKEHLVPEAEPEAAADVDAEAPTKRKPRAPKAAADLGADTEAQTAGDDTLAGAVGDDTVTGGEGNDTLTGGDAVEGE